MPPKFNLRVAVAADQNPSFRVYDAPSGDQVYETDDFVIGPGLARKEPGGQAPGSRTSLNDFHLLGELGSGASSRVYKALHRPTNGIYALKCLDITEQANRHQLVTELKALMQCAHPHVVSLVEAFFSERKIFMVLEFVDRGSLETILSQAMEMGQTLPEHVISLIVAQALLALCHLHESKRCVHRDLKPANVFVTADGIVKLGDFGVAAVQEYDKTNRDQTTFVGTAKYMSPERVQGQPYSYPADIWSLGVISLECKTGHFPWHVTNGFFDLFQQIVNNPVPLPEPGQCSDEFIDFIARSLEKDPSHRMTARSAYMHPYIQKHLSLETVALKHWLATIEPKS